VKSGLQIYQHPKQKLYFKVSDLKKVIQGSISFETIVVDKDQNVMHKSIDQMLLDTYNMYCKTTEKMINEEMNRLNTNISEYISLQKIRPVIAKGITSKKLTNDILDDIEKLTDVSKQVAKELINKYKINKLLTLDIDVDELDKQIKQLEEILKQIVPYVLEDYNSFLKSK